MIDDYTLYVDNFRGFKNTFVPISHINFLVGENSSGKTSLLSLLKLLSQGLLYDNQFQTDDIDLGNFQDIVSAHTDEPNYFRIGMLRWDITPTHKMPMAVLITYEKHEGLPRDLCFTCTFGKKEVVLRRVGKEYHFKMRDEAITPATDIKALFPRWIREHRKPGKDFKRLDLPYREDRSLLFPVSMVAQNMAWKSERPAPMLNPEVFPSTFWIAPIRTRPRRTYDATGRTFSSEGTHTPYVLRKMLDTKSQAKRFAGMIQRVGRDSHLFDKVVINRFGADESSPFEVQIVLGKKSFNIVNVGYGVSQSLPVMVEILWRPKHSWFAIQQPEVHLHPRAQAALGDLLFATATTEDKRFLIETHSDFMIDRYRSHLRTTAQSSDPTSQILFFERRNDCNVVTRLQIGKDGELPEAQPASYRRFFIKEQLDLLGL
jgi:hypothetical protein